MRPGFIRGRFWAVRDLNNTKYNCAQVLILSSKVWNRVIESFKVFFRSFSAFKGLRYRNSSWSGPGWGLFSQNNRQRVYTKHAGPSWPPCWTFYPSFALSLTPSSLIYHFQWSMVNRLKYYQVLRGFNNFKKYPPKPIAQRTQNINVPLIVNQGRSYPLFSYEPLVLYYVWFLQNKANLALV